MKGDAARGYRFERVRLRELMDDPSLDPALRAEALRGIERISHWWGQRKPLLRAIAKRLGPPGQGHWSLREVGAGSGHLSRWIALELGARGYDVEVTPTDLFSGPGVTVQDCLARPQPEADLYFSSLLLHHLGDWQVCEMMAEQARCSRLGFVHFDLQRHWLHYVVAWIGTRLFRLHPINCVDALRSIQQGYSFAELSALPRAAGLNAEVRWCLPFHWMVTWKK